MHILEERIRKDGQVLAGGVLKVDGFLNHQMDINLLNQMGQEWKRLFEGYGVNKILTIEASGIGIACIAAQYFGCPVVFAKKSKSKNIPGDVWSARVESFTHGNINDVFVSKRYLSEDDRVLLIDDFLAHGEALRGLVDIVTQAGATVVGAGIAVEKAFQGGGDWLRAQGLRIESLARVAEMDPETGLRFC